MSARGRASALALALILGACGGGGDVPRAPVVVPQPPPPPPPPRGAIVGSGPTVVPIGAGAAAVAKLEPAVFAALLENAQSGTTAITGTPKCAITTYSVKYNTVGAVGEATTASAAIMVPSGAAPECSGARPLLLYAHGTSVEKTYDMTNLAANTEARLVAAMFAAQGFIVVAPNYAGYAGSALPYHPYLDANAQASDMVDALRAARVGLGATAATASSKLFISGYSQGGYVAVATQRAMQIEYPGEFSPSATAGMSGPYALTQFGDAIFAGAPRLGVTAFLPLLINAGQRAGGALYASTSEVYEAQYASGIDTLLPSLLSIDDLVKGGKLPASALFARDSQPQGADAGAFFGDGNLVRSSYRSAYLADLQAHPCGASAADPLACAPQHALRKHVLKNDLRNYVPATPLLLCGGDGDPTVPYLNTASMLAYLNARGMHGVALTEVDLDSLPGVNDPYRTPKLSFASAKLALRLAAIKNGDSPSTAVEVNYHAGLVAPFCMMAVRDYLRAKLTE
ncbi:MAG: prolyl oligopeptidase family serine peptidase [Pseudomonadota bacterium]